MTDGFLVNNPGLEEANYELNAAVGLAGQILEDLNTFLKGMATATQNSAVPLWEDLQRKWNGDYDYMVQKIEAGHRASVDAHDWYKGGDLQSVRIMSGG